MELKGGLEALGLLSRTKFVLQNRLIIAYADTPLCPYASTFRGNFWAAQTVRTTPSVTIEGQSPASASHAVVTELGYKAIHVGLIDDAIRAFQVPGVAARQWRAAVKEGVVLWIYAFLLPKVPPRYHQ